MHAAGTVATLFQRTDRMYRQLVLLQRLFQAPNEPEDVEWLDTGSRGTDVALCTAIRELIEELMEHARILTSVPIPLSEWRPGDAPDDERWRTLTEVERREVLSMLGCYENLVSWGEAVTTEAAAGGGFSVGAALAGSPPHDLYKSIEYLKAERSRVARFRDDLRFLDKANEASRSGPRSASAS